MQATKYAGFHEVTGATIQVYGEGDCWNWRRGRVGYAPESTGGPFASAEAAYLDAMQLEAEREERRRQQALESEERWREGRIRRFTEQMLKGELVVGATDEEWDAAYRRFVEASQ